MAARVGGLNVTIGADTAQLLRGVKLVESRLRSFRNRMKTIRLAGAVKGDPFSETKNYMKEATKELDSVFKEWAVHVDTIGSKMSKFGQQSKKVTDDIIRSYTRAKNRFDKLVKAGGGARGGPFGIGEGTLFGSITGEDLKKDDVRKQVVAVAEQFRGMAGPVDKAINRLVQSISKGRVKSTGALKVMLNSIRHHIEESGKDIKDAYRDIGGELEKGFIQQRRLAQKEAIRQAESTTLAHTRRTRALKEVWVEEKRLRTEIKMGINVDENKLKLADALHKRKALGARLSKAETRELKELRKAQEDANRSVARAGFLTRRWFKERVRWFVELRLLWGLYRRVGDGLRSMTEAQVQLSRAMRTARSEVASQITIMNQYRRGMQQVAMQFGSTWEQAGEVLYQLGSAGLSAEESLAGLNSTMALIIGTEGDARETTKAIAGIYNNFRDTITGVNTEQEKLAKINDLVAVAWRDHQVEIQELTDGYKHASAMATVMGVSIEELTSLLAVANDHMIKGGRAGRALSNLWSRMSRAPISFAQIFGLEDIDINKPLDFMKIMGEMHQKLRDQQLSVAEIGAMFERFGLRAAPIMATLVKHWDEIGVAMDDFGNITDEATRLAEKRLDNLDGQWKRFVGNMRAYAMAADGILAPVKEALRIYANFFQSLREGAIGGKEKLLQEKDRSEKILKEIEEDLARMRKADEDGERGEARRAKLRVERLKQRAWHVGNLIRLNMKLAEVERKEDERKKKVTAPPPGPGAGKGDTAIERKVAIKMAGDVKAEKLLREQLAERREALKARFADYERAPTPAARKELGEEVLKIMREIEQIESEINSIVKERMREKREEIRTEKERLQNRIKALKSEREELRLKGTTREEGQRIYSINKEIEKVQNKIVELGRDGAELSGKDAVAKEKAKEDERNRLEILKGILQERAKLTQMEIDAKEEEIFRAKVRHATDLEILQLQKDKHEITLKDLEAKKELELTELEQLEINREIRNEKREILEIDEKILRKSSKWYDFYQRMKEGMKSFHDLVVESGVQFAKGTAEGLGKGMSMVTGGFQEQKQEIINLRHELAQLKRAYDEAVDEGDVEKAEHIKNQMAELRQNIEDLEDPIHNLKEHFRSFFKDLVDNIRDAINQWIAMQIVMGLISGVSGAMATPTYTYAPSGGVGTKGTVALSGPSMTHKGRGGVLPNIKSFQSFSRGGMTGRPTLAVLGDNPSSKEIVIPEENIESDQVSGYVRESDGSPINIINVITPEDVAAAMGQASGERVILNTIGKDMANRGRTYNRM